MGSILLSRFSLGGPAGRAGRFLAPVVVTLGCILALPAGAFADSFSVSEWFLSCAASNPSISEYQSAFFDVVQSPFVGQHSVSLPSSPLTSSSAQYVIEYLSNSGSFHIASQQEARGLSSASIYTRAEGQIRVSTTEAIPLHIESSWTYNMPADYMMSRFYVLVSSDEYPSTVLFYQSYHPQTWPGDPWSGTLTIQGNVILPPGPTWIMSYNMQLEADAGPNFSATGNGYVDFTITPEVSSLAMLAPALLLAFARQWHAPSP